MSESGIPERTTPTWEMELLVSGATIFGLLQLPALIDRVFFRVLNLSPDGYEGLLTPLWMYSKIAVVTLVLTFVVHLCLRGYWVALVGMDSVYPGGIRWEKLERGALARAGNQRRAPGMASIIERADNRATSVFGIGFGFAMVLLIPITLVLVALGLGLATDLAFGPGHMSQVLLIFMCLAVVPWVLARQLDRSLGERLDPGKGLGRRISAVLGFYSRLGMGRGSNPLVGLFVSHEGRGRASLVALVLVGPVMAGLLLQIWVGRGHSPLDYFVGISAEDATSPNNSPPAFYADLGTPDLVEIPLPHIPSRIAQGPYVELFIPLLPRFHGQAMQSACPQAMAAKVGPQATQARLQCLATLTDIRLDGQSLNLPLLASTDSKSQQPGVLAMVPVVSLAAGQHEISLARPSRTGRSPTRYRIVFWK